MSNVSFLVDISFGSYADIDHDWFAAQTLDVSFGSYADIEHDWFAAHTLGRRAAGRTMRPTVLALIACAAAAAPDASEVQARLKIDATHTDTITLVVDTISRIYNGDDFGLVDVESLLWMTGRTWLDKKCVISRNSECANLKSLVEYLVNDKRASPTKVVDWSQQSTIELMISSIFFTIPDETMILLKIFLSAVTNHQECNGWETSQIFINQAIRGNVDFAQTLLTSPCTFVKPSVIVTCASHIFKNDDLVTRLVAKASASDVEMVVADPQHGEYIERLLELSQYPDKQNIIRNGKAKRASYIETLTDIGFSGNIDNGDILALQIASLHIISPPIHALVEHLETTRGIYYNLSECALNDLDSPFTKYALTNLPRMLPLMISNLNPKHGDVFFILNQLFKLKDNKSISPATECEIFSDVAPLGMELCWSAWPESTSALPDLWNVMMSVFKKYTIPPNIYITRALPTNEVYYAAFLLAVHDQAAFEMMTEEDVRAFLQKHRRAIKNGMLPVGSTEDARAFIVDRVNEMKGIKKHESAVEPDAQNSPSTTVTPLDSSSLKQCMNTVNVVALVLALAFVV